MYENWRDFPVGSVPESDTRAPSTIRLRKRLLWRLSGCLSHDFSSVSKVPLPHAPRSLILLPRGCTFASRPACSRASSLVVCTSTHFYQRVRGGLIAHDEFYALHRVTVRNYCKGCENSV